MLLHRGGGGGREGGSSIGLAAAYEQGNGKHEGLLELFLFRKHQLEYLLSYVFRWGKVIVEKLYTKSSHHTKLMQPLHAYELGVKKWSSFGHFGAYEQEYICLQQIPC